MEAQLEWRSLVSASVLSFKSYCSGSGVKNVLRLFGEAVSGSSGALNSRGTY